MAFGTHSEAVLDQKTSGGVFKFKSIGSVLFVISNFINHKYVVYLSNQINCP